MSSRRPSKPATRRGKTSESNAQPQGAARQGRDAKRAPGTRGGRAGGAAGAARGRGGAASSGEREISAGGVVVRDGEVAVIVPTRRAADGSRVLSLPKGHVDPGETPLQAAGREVREEAGVVAEPVRELGESRYWYRRDGRTIGKSVYFYLFDYTRGKTEDHDDEVEEARWMPLKEAEKKLTYPAEREMVARARAHLEEGERKDR
jgi:8-oxo-dGTP pyrophosphatase MutT (NUDIX family)